MADNPVKITIFDNGPLEVMGPATLVSESGHVVEVVAGEPFYLCRCGGSKDKPFCDGSHDDQKFESTIRAAENA